MCFSVLRCLLITGYIQFPWGFSQHSFICVYMRTWMCIFFIKFGKIWSLFFKITYVYLKILFWSNFRSTETCLFSHLEHSLLCCACTKGTACMDPSLRHSPKLCFTKEREKHQNHIHSTPCPLVPLKRPLCDNNSQAATSSKSFMSG